MGFFVQFSSPVKYAQTINQFQAHTKVPLYVGCNYNHNINEVFDSVPNFYGYRENAFVYDKRIENEINLERKILGITLNYNYNILRMIGTASTHGEYALNAFLSNSKFIEVFPEEVDQSIKRISKAIKKNKTLITQLDQSVRDILSEKYDAGLTHNRFINTDNLISKLNSPHAKLLQQQLAHSLVAIAKNDSNVLPIKNLSAKTFVSISIGDSSENEFTHYLSKYAFFKHYSINTLKDTVVFSEVKKADVIIVGFFNLVMEDLLKKFPTHPQIVICDFSNAEFNRYNRSHEFTLFSRFSTVLIAHSSEEGIPQVAAQIIFGGLSSKGKLPITDSFQNKISIKTDSLGRLSYQLPESAGMDSRVLEQIEPIAKEAIRIGATPGLHVFVAKDGKVVYEKSFGSFTYENKIAVTDETIFDLASLTKVSATLQAVMYMIEKGLVDVNKKASFYLPELKGTNKEDLTVKDILTHQAGLWPFLPFWAETVKDTSIWKKYYSKTESEDYPFSVSENMFASKSMKDSLWHWIIKAKVRDKTVRTIYDFRYSDMGFYIMQHLAEKILDVPLEDFLQKNFYRPLGAYTTGYLPLRKFPANQIAPTEKDTLFRKSLLVGYVHDQGAAMHGGIAGHAGLFSTANDLAKIGQMWLNKGSYGGIQFFKPETVELSTSKQYENSSRGLGWDKSLFNNPSTSIYASPKTFGHTGFTGTSMWIDPEFNLVFVFLSNRVYPDMNNRKILNANTRTRIQDVVYQSIFEFCKK
ncbi:MAG: serine hydrolase [Cyclobacteriaceae bacterium]